MKRKKVKHIASTIDFGILPNYAYVSIGGNIDDAIAYETDKGWLYYFKALKEDGLTINFANRTEIDGITYFSLFIENKKDESWYSILAHELIHMCQFLCDQHHVDMIREKEMVAYLHTHLMNQVISINKKINEKATRTNTK